jgi:hypothetical protein
VAWKVRFYIEGSVDIEPPPRVRGVIFFTTKEGAVMGEITVQDDETTLRATIQLLDAEGNPATPDDTPQWEVGDSSVLTVTPSDDGMSASFEVGAPGASSVTVTTTETHGGEGDPTPVVLTGLVTVIAGDTVSGSVEFTTG